MRIADIEQDGERRGPSRRDLLRGGMLAALAATAGPLTGCSLLDREPEPVPEPDPLALLITGALGLAAQHEAAVASNAELAERLAPIAAAHRAHAEELSRVTGTALPASASAVPPTATPGGGAPAEDAAALLARLRTAEQQGQKIAAEACATAPAGRAALVGSIAAARATHAEVLR